MRDTEKTKIGHKDTKTQRGRKVRSSENKKVGEFFPSLLSLNFVTLCLSGKIPF